MQNVIIDGVEVELDDGIDPEEVEKYGADSRDDEVDTAEAEADSSREDDDAEEV